MKTIKFITFYSNNNSVIERNPNVAGEEITNYISSILIELGYNLEIISMSGLSINTENIYIKQTKEIISDNFSVIYTPNFKPNNKINRILNFFISHIWLFCYCIKNFIKGETIIIYHSIPLMNIIKRLKFLKKLKIFIICEELYTVVSEQKRLPSIKKEKQYLSKFDAYLFPTKELNNIVNINNKPNIILPGVLVKEKKYNKKFDDNKIHIVYAGTFSKVKKGTYISIDTAKYLSEDYVMHILGFGSNKETVEIKNYINECNKNSKAEIRYEGLLKGEEFSQFLQKCHIGLSTQTSEGEYNNTSFPSKILKYMANGLRVVTVDIPVVRNSLIGKYMNYYDNNDPKKIAEIIMNINFNDNYNSFQIIENFNKKAIKEMGNILKNL